MVRAVEQIEGRKTKKLIYIRGRENEVGLKGGQVRGRHGKPGRVNRVLNVEQTEGRKAKEKVIFKGEGGRGQAEGRAV